MTGVTYQHVRESNLIEGVDSRFADFVCLGAWEYLRLRDQLQLNDLLFVHELVVASEHPFDETVGDWAGEWRRSDIRVGDWVAPPWRQVRERVKTWLAELTHDLAYERLLTPRETHVRFEKIHPFVDGNGRTGRLLMWWHEDRLGLEPTLIYSITKWDEYYPWFHDV